VDDLKEKRRYWKLKEEAPHHSLWRVHSGRGYGPVARPTEATALCEEFHQRRILYICTTHLRRCTSAVNTTIGHNYKTSYLQYGSHDVCN